MGWYLFRVVFVVRPGNASSGLKVLCCKKNSFIQCSAQRSAHHLGFSHLKENNGLVRDLLDLHRGSYANICQGKPMHLLICDFTNPTPHNRSDLSLFTHCTMFMTEWISNGKHSDCTAWAWEISLWNNIL